MRLTEREIDKLLIFTAADVARRRRHRGLKLNHPEAVALITAEVLEGIRDGKSVADLMALGAQVLTRADVMEGIAGDDPGNPGRRHVSRRHEARDRPRSIRDAMIPGELLPARRTDRAECRSRSRAAPRRQPRRSADPGRIAHALLRGQPIPALRSRARRTAAASTSPRAPRSGSSPARAARSISCRSAGHARVFGMSALVNGSLDDERDARARARARAQGFTGERR